MRRQGGRVRQSSRAYDVSRREAPARGPIGSNERGASARTPRNSTRRRRTGRRATAQVCTARPRSRRRRTRRSPTKRLRKKAARRPLLGGRVARARPRTAAVASHLPHNVLQRHYTDACVRSTGQPRSPPRSPVPPLVHRRANSLSSRERTCAPARRTNFFLLFFLVFFLLFPFQRRSDCGLLGHFIM